MLLRLVIITFLIHTLDATDNEKMCRDIEPVLRARGATSPKVELINENTTILDAVLAEELITLRGNNSSTKNILTASMATTNEEDDFLATLSRRMNSLMTPFDPTKGQSASSTCQKHYQHFIQSLNNMDLWALKMHDASAKISSGILSGNANNFGDYDECLSIDEEPNGQFQGKYCLAYLQPNVPKTVRLRKLHDLVQSHGMIKSNLEDPGHRVPRFSQISWGLCIPSTCSNIDVERSLQSYLKNFTAGTGIEFRVRVEAEMCQVSDRNWIRNLDRGTITAACIFLAVLFWAIFCTYYDYTHEELTNQWMLAFSLRRNNQSLFSTVRESNDIEVVHGIRALNAFLLILSHRSMAAFYSPYINRTQMAELIGQPWTVIARAASLYTDPFIMMSGLLTSYSLLGRLQRGQSIKFFQEYIGRYLRIAPPLAALIGFCTYILPLMGSGPQWNLVVTHHSDICKVYWYRNLMFIHNYFGFENMCLTHSHHVGIDTQLFATAPILIMILWKWPRKGLMFVLGVAGVSTGARYYVTITRGLSNYVFFGTSVAQLFDTANYMYILPAHRATVYIMGILLGYILRNYKDVKLTQKQLNLGWTISGIVVAASFLGPAPMGMISYTYNPTHAALYAAFAPIGWCFAFAWIIFVSHLGYKSFLSEIFSWKGFMVTTRFSYAVYLTQFPIFFFTVGITRSSEFYQFLSMTINYNEYFWIVFFSYWLTVLFEMPFSNLKKLVFPVVGNSNKSKVSAEKLQLSKEMQQYNKTNHVNNNNNALENLLEKTQIETEKEKTC